MGNKSEKVLTENIIKYINKVDKIDTLLRKSYEIGHNYNVKYIKAKVNECLRRKFIDRYIKLQYTRFVIGKKEFWVFTFYEKKI